MKKFFYFSLFALLFVACVDEEYDLSKVNTDDTAIGGNQSEFVLPVVKIHLTLDQLSQSAGEGQISLDDLFKEVDIWLPTQLPGDIGYVEIDRLSYDADYLDTLLEDLFEEMNASEGKRLEVATLLANKYREDFVNMLPETVPSASCQAVLDASQEQAASLISDLYMAYNEEVVESISTISCTFLEDMELDDVTYRIPALDLGEDILDMITENLDPATVENPVNALYLFGLVESDFPFDFHMIPTIERLSLDFDTLEIQMGESVIKPVRLTAEDVRVIAEGSQLVMPTSIDRYYPGVERTPDMEVLIRFSLRKTGGLKL